MQKIKATPYAKFAYAASAKCISSSGQTNFCVDAAAKFLLHSANNPLQFYIVGVAMVAGFIVNTTLRLPVIYQQYIHGENSTLSKTYQLKHFSSKTLYYFIIMFGFISAEISDPLNAYLGCIVLMEKVFGFASVDIHNHWWKELITQFVGLALAVGIGFANFAYDFKFIKQNSQKLVAAVDERNFFCDKLLGLTIISSLPVLIGAPVLTFFFTGPAIDKIPGATQVLNHSVVLIFSAIISLAAFVKCIAAIPSIYTTLNQYHQPNETPLDFIRTNNKIRFFQVNATVNGCVDSIASGLCMLISIIAFTKLVLNLSDEQIYDWTLITIACVFAVSQAIQNAFFAIYPGYKETVKLFAPSTEETLPLVVTGRSRHSIQESYHQPLPL